MKKEDLKTGMYVVTDRRKFVVLKDTILRGYNNPADFVLYLDKNNFGWDLLHHAIIDGDKILEVYVANSIPDLYRLNESARGCFSNSDWNLLWQRQEQKPILELDGVEYSEDTLRSIIKKATNS